MNVPVDSGRRLAALDPQRSICVTAPAGSGKTELLSQRVLKLLARADQPEEILAITFTRKAAAEMHHRIIQSLHMAATSEQPEQAHQRLSWQLAADVLARDKNCGWRLLDNTNRLKILTIDSFCASLTRQMPMLSNFGAQPGITDAPQQCYRTAVHNFMQQLEQNSPCVEDLMLLLSHVDNDMARLERLLMILLERRDQWLLHIGIGADPATARIKLEQTLQQLIADVLTQLRHSLQPLAPELLPLLDYAGCNAQWQKNNSVVAHLAGIIELPGNDIDDLPQWLAIAELCLTKNHSWRKSVDKRTGFPTETEDGDKQLAKELKANFIGQLRALDDNHLLLQQLVELRYLPAAGYASQQWQVLESLTRLLPGLVAQLTLVFQQQGVVDYSQISMAALAALGDGLSPSELAMKLDQRLCHILVDEFQDTASPQFRLLERLVEGWKEHNHAQPERPNTLFIVGDGMQSIYGFREANVGLFLEARKQGVNGVELDDLSLTVNFRSDPEIIEWVNCTFSQAFPQTENLARGAVPFEYAEPFNPPSADSEIAVLGFSGEDGSIREAVRVAELARQSLQQQPDNKVAILVRSRSHLREILPQLVKAGLQWNASDIDPLAVYSPVKDLLTLTRALLNPADQISWAALMRTPWIGLTNADLYHLLSSSDHAGVWDAINSDKVLAHLTIHGRRRLLTVRKILGSAFDQRNRLASRCWLEGVWLALGGASAVTSRDEYELIDAFLDLFEQYQQQQTATAMLDFEQALDSLYAPAAVVSSKLYVMTIHKAKGLEFDTVILPRLGKASRADDKSLLMWREYLSPTDDSSGLIISPLAASGDEDDAIYQHLRFEQGQSNILENTRLFYVAATRAVSRLYILFSTSLDAASGLPKAPASNSLLSTAWPVLEPSVQWSIPAQEDAEQLGLNFDSKQTAPELYRINSEWQPPQWKFYNPLANGSAVNTSASSTGSDSVPTEINHQQLLPRVVGTVVHWIFERMATAGPEFWPQFELNQRNRWLQSLLHYHALPEHLWPQACEEIIIAVENTLQDEVGRWLLDSSHRQAASELGLLSTLGQSVEYKIIDRTFIDREGSCWIVDYKTALPRQGESRDQFIERETRLYWSQLTEYKTQLALTQASKTPIRMALYFTCYPYLQEIKS